jgi:hypothetical protein
MAYFYQIRWNVFLFLDFAIFISLLQNKMCYETQMPPYKANSRGGHHSQNSRSRFQNLQLQYKGLVTSNRHMKYKSPITYHSKDMAKVKVFKK